MNIDLTGKTAVVTGATEGIGLAIAQGLKAAGADVVICGRSEEKLQHALQSLSQTVGGSARGHAFDLSTAEGCLALTQAEPAADILINNLGIYEPGDIFTLSDERWEAMLNTNVMSGVRISRYYAAGMKDRGWGRIQFISSESALNIPQDMLHYGVSKAAMQGLSRGLAKTLAGTGVTVNTILPGPTLTEGVAAYMAALAEERGISAEEMQAVFLKENRPSTLLWRFAQPEEVASMCVYIASPQASYTSGAALKVEGGIVESIA